MITQVDMDFNQTSYMNNTHYNTNNNKYLNE